MKCKHPKSQRTRTDDLYNLHGETVPIVLEVCSACTAFRAAPRYRDGLRGPFSPFVPGPLRRVPRPEHSAPQEKS